MSYPTPTVFYIAVFREDQNGPQHKVLTSLSGLTRLAENIRQLKQQNESYDPGPFDVFVVNTETLECGRYDIEKLLDLLEPTRAKRKKSK